MTEQLMIIKNPKVQLDISKNKGISNGALIKYCLTTTSVEYAKKKKKILKIKL
jgi:hypothetical protein